MVKALQHLAPRFAEAQGLSQNSATLNEKAKMKPFNYKVTINVIKETDDAAAKPKDIKTVINFSKDSINLLKNKQIAKSIAYKE